MAAKPKLLIVTAVWGDWHIGAFHEINLPTLLSQGNFPSLAQHCDIHYVIYTSARDRERIERATVNDLLRPLMTLEVRLLRDDVLKNPIAAHHLAWNMAIEQAKRDGRLILLMPPDVAWADNSFRTVGQRLAEGYQAIFMTYLRAEEESLSAALRAEPHASDGSMTVAPERMVELCMDSLHPLMAAYLADSDYFPIHPEMMIWPVPGEGLLLRILAREMFLFDPRQVTLNKAQLPEKPLKPGEGCFIADSDELFAVSLAPFGKDAEWHREPRRADPVEIGGWWTAYDSATNDFIVSHRVRWHFAPVTEARWRAVESRSDLFIRRAAAVREGIRFWQQARRLGQPTVARLLAVAVHTGVMAHGLVGRTPAAVLMPTDQALAALRDDQIEALHAPHGARALAEIIRRHVVPLDEDLIFQDNPLRHHAERGGTAVCHRGGTYTLACSRHGTLFLDGRPLRRAPLAAGNHKLYLIDDLLIAPEEVDALLRTAAAAARPDAPRRRSVATA